MITKEQLDNYLKTKSDSSNLNNKDKVYYELGIVKQMLLQSINLTDNGKAVLIETIKQGK